MSLNHTPSADRIHIGIFGKRNAGKSSIINAITGQSLSIVSDIKGTTTDPVLKSMELLPLGPVVMIDTPGLDDTGDLGELRIKKAYQILNKTDIAILVIDGNEGITKEDEAILKRIQDKHIPCAIVKNKCDLKSSTETETASKNTNQRNTAVCPKDAPSVDSSIDTSSTDIPMIEVSAATGKNIQKLKDLIASLAPADDGKLRIVSDLISSGDFVVLVVPIDSAAPKGRLILPQQQTIRDILDTGAISIVSRESELKDTLASIGKTPALVITDSQAFEEVSQIVPEDILLTSFSILFARHKGILSTTVAGVKALDHLKDGDIVLISEGCTHHRQCDDIGTVKLPRWVKKHTGKDLNFEFSSGTGFPEDLSKYSLIIHCGSCMLNEREVRYRMQCAKDAKIPFTNYGIAIAYMKGILDRSIQVFKDRNIDI